MAYKNDGSSHWNGIKGEKQILEFFNDKNNWDFIKNSIEKIVNKKIKNKFNFIHRGGTQYKEDIYDEINDIKISIKSKKYNGKVYQGTFDLINTSKIEDYINKYNKESYLALNNYYKSIENLKESGNNNVENVRKILKSKINSILKTISGKIIMSIFEKIYNLENETILVIRDYKNDPSERIYIKDIHFIDKKWISKEAEKFDPNQKFNNSKQSSVIMNSDGSKSSCRLRIALNNGVESLMIQLKLIPEKKNKNKTSVLTFKIQVDKVKEIINKYDVNK